MKYTLFLGSFLTLVFFTNCSQTDSNTTGTENLVNEQNVQEENQTKEEIQNSTKNFMWNGSYQFEEIEDDKTWVYSLKLQKQVEKKYIGTLSIDGFQSMQRWNVEATEQEDGKLSVVLISYGEDNAFEYPEVGSELFILQEVSNDGGSQIMTYWKQLETMLQNTPKEGIAFKKK